MTISTSDTTEDLIRAEALALGFDLCRFTDLDDAWPAAARLTEFLQAERHGEMTWMAETAERRAHPRAMWTEARSALVLGMNYGPAADLWRCWPNPPAARSASTPRATTTTS